MKKKILFSIVGLVLVFALAFSLGVSRSHAEVYRDGEIFEVDAELEATQQLSCSITDEAGNPITSAVAGDVVKLQISHPATEGPRRIFIFKVPSNDPAMYSDLFLYVKEYGGTSSGATIYMKINPYTYVDGDGYFLGRVPGHPPCWAVLTITPP